VIEKVRQQPVFPSPSRTGTAEFSAFGRATLFISSIRLSGDEGLPYKVMVERFANKTIKTLRCTNQIAKIDV
jgi:hypothetical protein